MPVQFGLIITLIYATKKLSQNVSRASEFLLLLEPLPLSPSPSTERGWPRYVWAEGEVKL